MGRLNFDIDDDVHRLAKAAAALRGVSLRTFVESVVAEAARQELADEAGQKRRK